MWQALLNGVGQALAFFYDLVGSYGLAIILVVVAVRILMLPLTIKSTRSMQAMSKLQPELKALQKKHKGDRQKLQEETMKLYKEHQVNPLGGCLPLLLQMPVLFALFSVLRSAIPVAALPAEPVNLERATAETVFCRPAGEPSAEGFAPDTIECDFTGDRTYEESFAIEEWRDQAGRAPAYLTRCLPQEEEEGEGSVEFLCESPVGTRHLPRDSALFEDIVEDRATFLGMHLSCGATQAQSEQSIRFCAPPGTQAGGFPMVGYYGLIALMVVTTWYSFRQMQSSAPQQQPGMQMMMGRIMPVFLGFISLNFPAGVLVYWVTTNGWQIGQQHVMIKQRAAADEGKGPGAGSTDKPTGDGQPRKQAPKQPEGKGPAKQPGDAKPQAKQPGGRRRPGGKGGRSRKKRRKR
jgi:YidC/Oxa1 family membrane protein insertase